MSLTPPFNNGARIRARRSTLAALDAWHGAQGKNYGAPWQLNREPFHHRHPPYGAPGELKLPEDQLPVDDGGGASPAPRPPSAGASASCPEQQSFLLRVVIPFELEGRYAISTPSLPWPARIVGASLLFNGADTNALAWGVSETLAPYSGEVPANIGASLFDYRSTALDSTSVWLTVDRDTPIIAQADGSRFDPNHATTALLGRSVLDAGRYLTFIIQTSGAAGSPIEIALLLTLQECSQAAAAVQPRIVTAKAQKAPATKPATPSGGALPQSTGGQIIFGAGGAAAPLAGAAPAPTPGLRVIVATPQSAPAPAPAPFRPFIGAGPDPVKDAAQRGGVPAPLPVPTRSTSTRSTPAPAPTGGLNLPTGTTPFLGFVPTVAPKPVIIAANPGQTTTPFYRYG